MAEQVEFLKNEIKWTTATIEKRKNEWKTNSTPEFYTSEKTDVLLIVNRNEEIIYKRIIQN